MRDKTRSFLQYAVSRESELKKMVDEMEKALMDKLEFAWLSGWYATRLHAIHLKNFPESERASQPAICGAHVYKKAQSKWALRRLEKGIPRCKRCEKLVCKSE